MKYTSKTIGYLLITCIVLALSLVAYWYVYTKLNTQIGSTAEKVNRVAEETSQSDHEKKLANTLINTKSDLDLLNKFFVPYDQVVQFIEQVEAIGTVTGADVSIASINAEDLSVSEAGTIGHIKANVDIKGTWSQVMRAVQLAEQLPYGVKISQLRLDAFGIAKQPMWRAGFDIEVLSIK